MGQGVADTHVADRLDAGDHVTHRTGIEAVALFAAQPVQARFMHLVLAPGVHEAHAIAGLQAPVHHPHVEHYPTVGVVAGVEHERLEGCAVVSAG